MPKFSQKLFDKICERIANGESLRGICEDEDMPSTTAVTKWLAKDEKGEGLLVAQYAYAREAYADANADDIGYIGDQVLKGKYDPAAARVAIDAKKWTAGKMKPKKYADKHIHAGDEDNPIQVTQVERVIVKAPDKNG